MPLSTPMSLRIDFTEIAATQFYRLPHDVYAQIRSELVAAAERAASRPPRPTAPTGAVDVCRLEAGSFQVTYEVRPGTTHVRVLTIHPLRGAPPPTGVPRI